MWARHEPTRLLLDNAHDAFVSMDTAGNVTGWNPAAHATFGWTPAQALGRSLAELVVPPALREAHRRGLERFVETGEGRLVNRRIELTACHRDGHEFPVEITISPIRIWGQLTFNAFLHDISEGKRSEADLRRLADIVEVSEDAIISVTPDSVVTSWNRGAERLYGYAASEMLGRSVDRIVPAEQAAEKTQLRARLLAEELISQHETLRLRKNGTAVEVSLTVSALRDGDGMFNGLSVIARDVTERNRAERELREAHERFAGAFRDAPIGMAIVDLDGRFLSVNGPLCEITGRSETEMVATDFQAITHPADLDADLDHVQQMLTGEISKFEMEKRYKRPDGDVVWVQLNASIVRDAAGAPLHFIGQVQDISGRKSAEEELHQYADHLNALALQEPLTGLRNHRGFHAALDEELARARRYGGSFSVVLFDLDHFTQLNQDRGQQAGDEALRAAAATIQRACRRSDTAARVGGDELALILPETAGDAARMTAERIQVEIAALEDNVSVSLGVADWPADGDSKELLLLRADMALHAVKPRRPVPAAADPGTASPDRAGSRFAKQSIDRVLAMARDQLHMDVAYVAELRDDEQVLRALAGDAGSFGVRAGGVLSFQSTYCQRMVDGRLGHVVADAREHPTTRDLDITRQAGIGAYVGVPLQLSDGRLYGTLCCVSHAAHPELGESEVSLMEFLARVIAEQLENDELQAADRRAQLEVAGIHALIAALEARDQYTGQHSKTVVELATAVARELGMSSAQVLEVEHVAILHDIGKVGIPDAILQKRGPLNEPEWELMRQHPAIGARIVAGSPSLAHLAPTVRAEHERWDGNGYPDGLRGTAIPIGSRIAFACDAYHSMTSDRPYRAAMTQSAALTELKDNAGTQLDPRIVDALVRVIEAAPLHRLAEDRPSGGSSLDPPPRQPLPLRSLDPSPAARRWQAHTEPGASVTLGAGRCECRECGAHVRGSASATTLGGSCTNCGSYRLVELGN